MPNDDSTTSTFEGRDVIELKNIHYNENKEPRILPSVVTVNAEKEGSHTSFRAFATVAYTLVVSVASYYVKWAASIVAGVSTVRTSVRRRRPRPTTITALKRRNVRARRNSLFTRRRRVLPEQRLRRTPKNMEELHRIPYAHGSYFGAAPFLLDDPWWVDVLRRLMPDVYADVAEKMMLAPDHELVRWAVNNPVVAAYGVIKELERKVQKKKEGSSATLEWDVFLCPESVKTLESILLKRDRLLLQLGQEYRSPFELKTDDIRFTKKKDDEDDDDRQLLKSLVESDVEARCCARFLSETMLVAHGSTTQLILEQMGLFRSFNHSQVRRSRKTRGGGVDARSWLTIFAEALRTGANRAEDDDSFVCDKSPLSSNYLDHQPVPESVRLINMALGGGDNSDRLRLIIDSKSRRVSPRVWAMVVEALGAYGIQVEGVATFVHQEIRGLSDFSIAGILLCHTAGDLQRACHEGRVRKGDKIYFNGGSLLITERDRITGSTVYRLRPFAIDGSNSRSTVRAYKEAFDLSLGLYCQEFAIDDAAVNLLVKEVNRTDTVYDLGLSWGGLNGKTILRSSRSGIFTSMDGLWNQRYAGRKWNPKLYPDGLTVET